MPVISPLTHCLFDSLPFKDVISWSSIVSGYARQGLPTESILVFNQMVTSQNELNAFTLCTAIRACSNLGDAKLGACFRNIIPCRGFDTNHVIGSGIVGKNSFIVDAQRMFVELLKPDRIFCTSLISTLTLKEEFGEVVGFFRSMIQHGFMPDEFTFGTTMMTVGNLGRARLKREVHANIIMSGLGGAREACKLPFVIEAAPMCYGVPTVLRKR